MFSPKIMLACWNLLLSSKFWTAGVAHLSAYKEVILMIRIFSKFFDDQCKNMLINCK